MRTVRAASISESRALPSPGTTRANPLLPVISTASSRKPGIDKTPLITTSLSRVSTGGASEDHGASKRCSRPCWSSDGNTGGGPPRRTSGRVMGSQATRPCGEHLATSALLSSLPPRERQQSEGPRGPAFGDSSESFRRFFGDSHRPSRLGGLRGKLALWEERGCCLAPSCHLGAPGERGTARSPAVAPTLRARSCRPGRRSPWPASPHTACRA